MSSSRETASNGDSSAKPSNESWIIIEERAGLLRGCRNGGPAKSLAGYQTILRISWKRAMKQVSTPAAFWKGQLQAVHISELHDEDVCCDGDFVPSGFEYSVAQRLFETQASRTQSGSHVWCENNDGRIRQCDFFVLEAATSQGHSCQRARNDDCHGV